MWLFLFQLTNGRKRPLAVSAQGYNNLQTWYHKLWVLLYYRPTKFTAMAVGAALVEWEEPWISLICKLREENVEGDSQYTVETSRFISQLTRYIVKQRTEFDYYCRSSRLLTTTNVFLQYRSIPIQHSCFPFPIPSSFLLRKRSYFLCFGSHSFLRLLLTFSESSDQYIWVSQSLLCCSQLLGCMSVCMCVCVRF